MKWMIVSALVLGAGSAAAAGYVAIQSVEETYALESESVPVVEDSSDTDEVASEPLDSAAVASDTAEVNTTTEVAVVDSILAPPETNCPTVEVATASELEPEPEPAMPDPEAQRQAYRQVARILSNMGDTEVAQLLAHIEDEEIEVILRNVTAREGARLLSQLSGERAAVLSRRLLVATTDSGSSN
jgi:flagellar motility protein MotE (MotC chaperone)